MSNKTFKCPKCDWVSLNPNDLRNGYCGNCHEFTAPAQTLELDFPLIPWREPIIVRTPDDPTERFACRICIALAGLKERDVPMLTTDPEEVRKHIAESHA